MAGGTIAVQIEHNIASGLSYKIAKPIETLGLLDEQSAGRRDLPRAAALYQQALTMNRELNKPDGQAIALEGLGECHLTVGETETGTARLRQAVEIFQRLGMALDAERVRTRLADLTRAWAPDRFPGGEVSVEV